MEAHLLVRAGEALANRRLPVLVVVGAAVPIVDDLVEDRDKLLRDLGKVSKRVSAGAAQALTVLHSLRERAQRRQRWSSFMSQASLSSRDSR